MELRWLSDEEIEVIVEGCAVATGARGEMTRRFATNAARMAVRMALAVLQKRADGIDVQTVAL